MKSSLLAWFAARAALAAISASWTCPAGAAAGRPELAHCRRVVTHGKARIEIAQTRRLANPAKGSPHVCRAEVTVRGPAYEERRVYADIDPVGAGFGVAILDQPIGRFRAVAKLGDYDGRLLLVDEGGGVVDLPGPTYLVAGGRFLVLRHHTDAELAITIFDLDARRLAFSAQDDAMAALLGGDAEPDRRGRVRWLEVGGVLHAWLPPEPPGSRGVALQLHWALGTLVPATLSPEQIAGAREVAFQGLEGWQDCSCGARPERPRASREAAAAGAAAAARKAAEVIHEYVRRTRGWGRGQYRIEEHGREADLPAYWVVHHDDERDDEGMNRAGGGGKSFAVLYDPWRREVVRESAFQ